MPAEGVPTRGRPMPDTPPLHVHIENNRDLGDVFDLSEKRVDDALKRNPDAASVVRITVGYDGDGLDEALGTADALIAWKFDRSNLAERAPNLRWFHAIGAGINQYMPLDWLPRQVIFTNNRGVHGERASEYAITAILMLNNRVPEMVTHQRAARWNQVFNTAIDGKTLLIVGVGHVGGDTARHARHFGMQVIGIRRSGKPRRHVDEMYRPKDIPDLIPRSDFLLVTAPDTEQTHHLIGRSEIALMKRGAGIVNYSRAGLVDYEALRERLERGEISAVLDVFDPEPLPQSSPLWSTPNLIISPHCSSDDPSYYAPRTLDLVLDNALRLAQRRPLRNRVSRKLQY